MTMVGRSHTKQAAGLNQPIEAAQSRHLIPLHTRFPAVFRGICPSTVADINYGLAVRL